MLSRLIALWDTNRRIRFLVVGGWNTVVGWTTFFVLYALLSTWLNYLVIATISYVLIVTNAFVCQRMLVFRSRTPWPAAYLRFNITQLFALLWGIGGLAFFVQVVHLSPPVGQCIVLPIGLVLTYAMHRRFSFAVGIDEP
jgi:putative flippase GtrA